MMLWLSEAWGEAIVLCSSMVDFVIYPTDLVRDKSGGPTIV